MAQPEESSRSRMSVNVGRTDIDDHQRNTHLPYRYETKMRHLTNESMAVRLLYRLTKNTVSCADKAGHWQPTPTPNMPPDQRYVSEYST
jgi:hypothetical protein